MGIIGFSQGAAVAAVIASILEEPTKQNLFSAIHHPPVKFFISVSGFRMRFKMYDELYHINTPSLHVIGTLVYHPETLLMVGYCCDGIKDDSIS